MIGTVQNRVFTVEVAHEFPRAADKETPYYSMLLDGSKLGHVAGIRQFYAEYKWYKMGVDASQAGAAVVEALTARGIPAEPINFTNDWKNDANNFFSWCVAQKQIKIPREHVELITQILEQQRIIGKSVSGRVMYAHPTGRHDDQYYSMILALWMARPYIISGQGTIAVGQMGAQRDNRHSLGDQYGI